MDHNPPIYSFLDLAQMSEKEILIAQYQLQLATVSLFFALLVFVLAVLTLRWILPKFWHKSRGAV